MTGVYVHHIWVSLTIVRLSSDIEENPGPKCNSDQSFSICHWNLNSITTHNYLKIFLLRAYITLHNFDVVCISTTALDENLEIAGYNLLRADMHLTVKEAVFVYIIKVHLLIYKKAEFLKF